MRGKGARSWTEGQDAHKHPSVPTSDLHRGGQFPAPLRTLFSQAWLCPGLCFLVLMPLSAMLLPTSPAPSPFVQTLLSLFPPSHGCTIGVLHPAGSRSLNPSAWSTLPPSSASRIRNHLLQGAHSDPPIESKLSWTLSKPHLPLSIITHQLFLHMPPQILAAARWKICKGDWGEKIVLSLKHVKKPAK